MVLAPALRKDANVGSARSRRKRSITLPSSIGTLRSRRRSTCFPRRLFSLSLASSLMFSASLCPRPPERFGISDDCLPGREFERLPPAEEPVRMPLVQETHSIVFCHRAAVENRHRERGASAHLLADHFFNVDGDSSEILQG